MIDLRDPSLDPHDVIAALRLQPHPEGGHFRETWRDVPPDGSRGASTAILFLLGLDELSAWHRVDADELWFWQAGGPLSLTTSPDGHDAEARTLGPDAGLGQYLQAVVPRQHWQCAVSLGRWTLVSCVVAPAFSFEGFELAPPGWRPTPRPKGAR
ncbi:cupin domain-containing protein [Acetobacteraceae bacterium KSS8]|uniref:Cupin domain-containing protein n=1 Tax=Endosaccharibacter trunci TaxID=2812733 RepID=A0ABT1W454_9PROT|nr:cupin domain-containing protein [Acetobacteraceae bacterium KSS8]